MSEKTEETSTHIEPNRLQTVNSDEYIQFMYAINDPKKETTAVKSIREAVKKNNLPDSIIFPDYRKRVTKENRSWRQRKKLNVYTDESCLDDSENMTGVKKGDWERVYWYIFKKPSEEFTEVEEPKAEMKKV